MKRWFHNFMAGRYGGDELSFTAFFIYLGLCMFSIFVDSDLLRILSALLILWAFYRMLSRNIEARSAENRAYMHFLNQMGLKSRARKARRQDKEHRYYRCKKCGTVMRVPKGVGRIEITCPKCGEKITKKV